MNYQKILAVIEPELSTQKSLARANELPDYSEVTIETLKIIESQNN